MDFFIVNMVVLDIFFLFLVMFIINNVKLYWNSNLVICKIVYYFFFVLYVVIMLMLCMIVLDCFYGICLLIKYR